MRRCGKRWTSKEAAERSKRAQRGSYMAIPCRCEGWHLQPLVLRALPTRKPQEDTGPDRKTRALVCERDGYRCVRCGIPCGPGIAQYSLQHRVARGVGGDSSAPNLILLHGSATTGCHAEVERRGEHDNAAGYWLNSWQDPAAEGVMYASEHGSGITLWLAVDGGLLAAPPEAAA